MRLTLDPQEDTPTYYANFVEVSHGPYDFGIAAARIPTKMSAEKLKVATEGALAWKPNVQLVLPAAIIPGLIKALQDQYARYESELNKSAPEKSDE